MGLPTFRIRKSIRPEQLANIAKKSKEFWDLYGNEGLTRKQLANPFGYVCNDRYREPKIGDIVMITNWDKFTIAKYQILYEKSHNRLVVSDVIPIMIDDENGYKYWHYEILVKTTNDANPREYGPIISGEYMFYK